MKKKIFLVLVAVLLTTASAFAKTYIVTIICSDGTQHSVYVGGVSSAQEAINALRGVAICE